MRSRYDPLDSASASGVNVLGDLTELDAGQAVLRLTHGKSSSE
jgi:hypothetical protein